jgi:hypothetical protein
MQLVALLAVVLISIAAAVASAEAILSLVFRLLSKMR